MSASPVIDVDNLRVTYGDFTAVKDLSFQIERGELYALLAADTRAFDHDLSMAPAMGGHDGRATLDC